MRNPVARRFVSACTKPIPLPPQRAIPCSRAIAATRSASGGIPGSGGSSSNSEENVTTLPAPDSPASRTACSSRWFATPTIARSTGPGTSAIDGIAPVPEHLVVARVHRVDVAVEAAALQLEQHLLPERPFLHGGADDRDRARLQHPLERRPFCFGHERFLIALSFTAARYAFQPGMPLTPPPAWVAEEPWYRPLIGVRKSA